MSDFCLHSFWHSLPQKDTLRLYYLNLKRVRASPRAFWPEINMRRFSWKETNKKSLAEISLRFEAAESPLKNNCFKQVRWESQWHHGCVPLPFQKNILRKWRLEEMKTCLLNPEQFCISLWCILLDHYLWEA